MRAHVAIETAAGLPGFVIRTKGMEQFAAGMRVQFIPNVTVFYFELIDAARDFCVACDFTWYVSVPPLDLKPPRGRA